jgi:SAM-dependent methyltransferase
LTEDNVQKSDDSDFADRENAKFWNYLCGTNAATYMGFDLATSDGVRDFDKWYMDFYPYLRPYIDWAIADSKSCLEVGLGLGTVSRYISRNIQEFTALDVAPEPCIFLEKSIDVNSAILNTVNKSILEGPISTRDGDRFDVAIAIGSLHHSGNLSVALSNLVSSVKPGGKILVMVYNEFSFYRFVNNPLRFMHRVFLTKSKKNYSWSEKDNSIRAVNDTNDIGEAAPHTAYSSKSIFESRLDSKWNVKSENISGFRLFGRLIDRKKLLPIVRLSGGLDLYAMGIKSADPK